MGGLDRRRAREKSLEAMPVPPVVLPDSYYHQEIKKLRPKSRKKLKGIMLAAIKARSKHRSFRLKAKLTPKS